MQAGGAEDAELARARLDAERKQRVDQQRGRNEQEKTEAKEKAKEIVEVFNSNEGVEEAFEQALKEAVETSNQERDKRIAELEKQLSDVTVREAKAKTPKNKKYRVDESKRKEALKTLLEFSANPFLDPRKWQALGTLATYHLERGYYKFEDFYKKMKKELGGQYEEYYADLYNEAKQVQIENGVSGEEFDSDEEVNRLAEKKYQEIENAKKEIEELKKQKEIESLITQFGGCLVKLLLRL